MNMATKQFFVRVSYYAERVWLKSSMCMELVCFQWEALGKLALGFGFFGAVGYTAAYLNEQNPAPFAKVSREAVYTELGGDRIVSSAKKVTESDQ